MTENSPRGNLLKHGISLISMLAIISVAVMILSEDKVNSENPFDLPIESYNQIPKELINHQLEQKIQIPCTRLYAVTVDPGNNIYASIEAGVIKYNSFGSELLRIASPEPIRTLTIKETGEIYGASARKIFLVDPSEKSLTDLLTLEQSALITSIAVNGNNIFIADAGNRIVWHYDIQGTMIKRIGGAEIRDDRPGFVIPSPFFDLAIEANNFLWVVNPGRHTFEKYSFDGKLIQEWGRFSAAVDGFCGCCNPSHFALIPGGGFVTSEKGLVRIKIYNTDTQLESVVSGPEHFKRMAKGLDLAVDSDLRIIVADPSSKSIKIFTPNRES